MFIYQATRQGGRRVGASGLSIFSKKKSSQSSYTTRAFNSFPETTASVGTTAPYPHSTLFTSRPIVRAWNSSQGGARSFTAGSKLHQQAVQAGLNSAPTQQKTLSSKLPLLLLVSILSAAAGAYAVMSVIGKNLLPKLSDAESATAFQAEHEHQVEVEEYINNHSLVKSLRANPAFSESRPHLRFSDAHRTTSLTAGVLSGPGRIVVPPVVFLDETAKEMVMVCYLGDLVCGYPGFVHGGLLATLLDEGLGRTTFTALPNKVGMTANLNINYRAPTKAGQYIVMRSRVTKAEGRKAWAEGRIETLPMSEGEKPVVLVEGSGLFVEPKQVKLVSLVTGPIAA